MIVSMNEELKSFQDLAENYATKELAPKREENDKYPFGPFFSSALAKAHELGFLSVTLPEEAGGIGQDIGALCVILSCISTADGSLAGIIFANSLAQEVAMKAGETALLAELASAATAEGSLLAFPAYVNPLDMDSFIFAKKKDNHYFLTGKLDYLTLGGLSSKALIPAKIQGQEDYSFFVIDLSSAEVIKSEPIFSLGFHACPSVDISLNNVAAALIGEEGKGALYFEDAADRMHVASAAISMGIMKGSFDEALNYAKERFQGGRQIINWSEVKMLLANIAIKIKNADITIAGVCRAIESNYPDWSLYSRAAALQVQEMACDVTIDGVQLLGGNGYMKDYGQEKRLRDAKQAQALLGLVPMEKIRFMNKLTE